MNEILAQKFHKSLTFSANAVGITLDMKARNFPVLKNAEISTILSPNFIVQSSNFSLPRRVSPAETRSSVNSEHFTQHSLVW
jgi:hypothetical protein